MIESGVMQGSKLGPILFIIFINDLLTQLENCGLGAYIAKIVISVLGYADDILLIADNPGKMQQLIHICGEWSIKNGMSFNIDKCKVMPLNCAKKNINLSIYNQPLEIVDSYKYLGILISRTRLTSLYSAHISRIIRKAEGRVNCIKHLGFKCDGLRPVTCIIKMFKVLVRPILEYAAQVISYRKYNNPRKNKDSQPDRGSGEPKISNLVKHVEAFQNKVLKKLIPSPISTPPAVLRILSGIVPIAGRIDILKLPFFWASKRCSFFKAFKVLNNSKH